MEIYNEKETPKQQLIKGFVKLHQVGDVVELDMVDTQGAHLQTLGTVTEDGLELWGLFEDCGVKQVERDGNNYVNVTYDK